MLVVLPFTVVVNDDMLLALEVIFPSAVLRSVVRVVIFVELADILLLAVVKPVLSVLIFVALVDILLLAVAISESLLDMFVVFVFTVLVKDVTLLALLVIYQLMQQILIRLILV